VLSGRSWQHKNTSIQAFRSVPGYQTCMCKRDIRFGLDSILNNNS